LMLGFDKTWKIGRECRDMTKQKKGLEATYG
jgi:hypothetical protein